MIYTITIREKNGHGEVSRDYHIDDSESNEYYREIISDMIATVQLSKEVKF